MSVVWFLCMEVYCAMCVLCGVVWCLSWVMCCGVQYCVCFSGMYSVSSVWCVICVMFVVICVWCIVCGMCDVWCV